MDPRHALLAEVVRIAGADPGLAALGGRIFDGVPVGAEHPFLAVAEVTTAALDGDAPPTLEHRVEIEAVSRVSRAEASGIAARLLAALEDGVPAPAGLTLTGLVHLGTAVRAAKDGRSWSARVRLRAVTREE